MNEKSRDRDPAGPWDALALTMLDDWDPGWARACRVMSVNPWAGTVLPRPFVELVSVAVSVACTNLDRVGTRRHIRAALDAGATREQF